jgi:CDP-4-dehydro-6-deoxyglucose reductase
MPNPQFTKPWHGVPREEILWNPTVDVNACIGCGTCVTGCSRLVYRYDYNSQKAVVVDPLNCMVGCTTCANTCPVNAISFPPLKTVLDLEHRPQVHHVIEDDLLARREQLEWHDVLPNAERRIRLSVTSIENVGLRTRLLNLSPLDASDCLCQFIPGQYILLEIPGTGWLARAYSIGSAPRADGSIELQIRRSDEGRETSWLFDKIAMGDTLIAHGPAGNFTLSSPPSASLLFVAGGTGFAPIKAMLESLLTLDLDRSIYLVWGNRQAGDFYNLDDLRTWVRSSPLFQVVLAVETDDAQLNVPTGVTIFKGRVDQAIANLKDMSNFEAYVAGPPAMVVPTLAALDTLGIPRAHIRVDSFGA